MNEHLFQKDFFFSCSKCEMCDHSAILIAYVARGAVAAGFVTGSHRSSQSPSKTLSTQPTRQPPTALTSAIVLGSPGASHGRGRRPGARAGGQDERQPDPLRPAQRSGKSQDLGSHRPRSRVLLNNSPELGFDPVSELSEPQFPHL